MIVMFITTSGDGVIGTSDVNVNSYDCDTNAEHEYLFLILFSSWSEATMM